MSAYYVVFSASAWYSVRVEADSYEEAEEKAVAHNDNHPAGRLCLQCATGMNSAVFTPDRDRSWYEPELPGLAESAAENVSSLYGRG